jgi:hypothetical protein
MPLDSPQKLPRFPVQIISRIRIRGLDGTLAIGEDLLEIFHLLPAPCALDQVSFNARVIGAGQFASDELSYLFQRWVARLSIHLSERLRYIFTKLSIPHG